MTPQNPKTWTKYICTIGPASWSPDMLEGLIANGADILRTNFAHAKYDEYTERRRIIMDINKRLGTDAKMMADLQGPNIRIGSDIPEEGMVIEAGKEYTFYTAAGEKQGPDEILINDQTLHLDVKAGEPITFMDGAVEGEILWVEGHRIGVRMINGSKAFKPRKSVNVPDTELSSPNITKKDYKDLDFLKDAGVEYLCLSFVSSRKEFDEVRTIIGDRPIKLIAKIERRAAIKNLQEIIEASDGVMIARGDLGIEMPMEEIPILQRQIIELCRTLGRPVITATQMLISMAENKRPTRAEVSDVANAVFLRSDAIMLSEETAAGVDPVNALTTMIKIARRAEDYLYKQPNSFDRL